MCSGWQVPTTNAGSQQKPLLLPEQKTPLWFIKCICQLASAQGWESQTCCRRPRSGRGLTSVTVSEHLGVHCLYSAGKLDPIPTRVQLNQVLWLHLESCHTPSVSYSQDLRGVIPLHLQDLSPNWPVLHCRFYDTVIIINSTLIQKTYPVYGDVLQFPKTQSSANLLWLSGNLSQTCSHGTSTNICGTDKEN